MNWLADQARRHSGHDELVLREAARKALPDATDKVNRLWQRLIDTPRDTPEHKAAQEEFHSALLQHSAIEDLAGVAVKPGPTRAA